VIKHLQYVLAILVLGLALFVTLLCICAWDLHLRLTSPHLDQILTDADRTIVIAAGAATNIEKSLRAERDASKDQIESSTAAMKKFNATLDDLHLVLVNANGVVTHIDGAVVHVDAAVVQLTAQASTAIADLDVAVKDVQPILAHLGDASASLADLAKDPSIRASLIELDKATAETNSILANLDAIAASGNRDAQMLEARLRQALKPASLAKTIFERALGLAGPAASVATAVLVKK
jgi:hypothetical protein